MTHVVLPSRATADARGPSSAAVAATAAAGVILTYVLAVRSQIGQHLDTRAMVIVASHLAGTTWPQVLLDAIMPASVMLALAVLSLLAWAARGGVAAAGATGTAVGTLLAAVVLKSVLVRPSLVDAAPNSFPSGHVAAVAGLAAAAVMATTNRLRAAVMLAGAAATALTSVATLALQWHRASDVMASALLAVAVAGAVHAAAGVTAPDARELRRR